MAVAGCVGPVHGHALHPGTETAGDHALIRIRAQVHPGVELTQPALGGQLLAGVEQPFESVTGLPAWEYGAELHEAHVRTGLRAGSAVTHGQPVESRLTGQQYGVVKSLRVCGHDLAFQVQTLIHGVGQGTRAPR